MKYRTCNLCKKGCLVSEYDFELIRDCVKLFTERLQDEIRCALTVVDLSQCGNTNARMQAILKFYLTTEEICDGLGISEKTLWKTLRRCLGWGPPNKWKHVRQFDIISNVWRRLYGVEWKKKKR